MKAYVFPGQGAQFVGMGKDLYENVPKAKELFGWQAQYTLQDMCRDTWAWQSKNPQGYPKA